MLFPILEPSSPARRKTCKQNRFCVGVVWQTQSIQHVVQTKRSCSVTKWKDGYTVHYFMNLMKNKSLSIELLNHMLTGSTTWFTASPLIFPFASPAKYTLFNIYEIDSIYEIFIRCNS